MEGGTIKIKVFINLDKIKSNLVDIRQKLDDKTQILLMLKADAYGHGLERVAEATCDIVDGYGVFSLEEGLKVRKISPKTPVFVNMLDENEIETAVQNSLSIGLSNNLQLAKIESLIEGGKVKADDVKIHLKVDSGMHRLGFDVGDIRGVCNRLKKIGCGFDGVYSHFGDHPDGQISRFDAACKIVKAHYPNAMRHIASTHTLNDVSKHYDCVRVGLAAYLGAMRVESEVVAARRVSAAEYIGYGDFKFDEPKNVAVVFGGYADGIDRERTSTVWCGGKEMKVIGVCMDSLIVDTGEELLNVHEKVLLLDPKRIDKTAKIMNTIPYTLMTAWRGRINKIYC